MAARRERGLFDPDAPPGESPFDHHVYVICSDGDIEEGVSHEVSALAAHQRLGNLIVLWDDNQISIEDDTNIAKSEDVAARYAAYGFHVQCVDWRGDDGYREDVEALHRALEAARDETGRPSFIQLRTIIGWPAPNKQNTGKAHGNALGADEVATTKEILGFDPARSFAVEDNVLAHAGGGPAGPGRSTRSGRQGSTPGPPPTPTGMPCSSGSPLEPYPTAGPAPCRSSRPIPRGWPRGRPRARSSTPSHPNSRNCGAARPTWPRATSPPSRASRRSRRRSTRRRSFRPTGTGERSTSESGSTGWAPSSTASCSTAAPARTAPRS